MAKMKICCLCFSPKTGTVILGCLGILVSILFLVPHCEMIENHEFYIREFVKNMRATGVRDISDDDIPTIRNFSKMMWAMLVAVDVIYIFASILLIVAVAAEKRFLLVPWLVVKMLSILFVIVAILSVMFSFANFNSLVVLFSSAPSILIAVYFWYAVYSTFHQLRQEEETRRSNSRQSISRDEERVRALLSFRSGEDDQNGHEIVPESASLSTLDSIKGSIQRVMGGTPPPPYETVAMEAKEEAEKKYEHCELTLFSSVSDSPIAEPLLANEEQNESKPEQEVESSGESAETERVVENQTSLETIEETDDVIIDVSDDVIIDVSVEPIVIIDGERKEEVV